MASHPNFSDRLRAFRSLIGATQDEIATILGIKRKYVGRLENEPDLEPGEPLRMLFDLRVEEALATRQFPKLSPRELMRLARLSRGWDFAELGRRSGCRPDVLQAVEDGGGQCPEKVMDKMAAALGLRKDELMAGQDHDINRDNVQGTYGAIPEVEVLGNDAKPKYIPEISMAQAGTMDANSFTDEAYQRGAVLSFDVKNPRALAVKIVGDSMEDKYPEGSVAVMSPNTKPVNGDPVIARFKDGRVVFKWYTSTARGQRVVLISENPDHPTTEHDISDFDWIFPVINVVVRPGRWGG